MRICSVIILSSVLWINACASSTLPQSKPMVSLTDTTVVSSDVANNYVGTGNTIPTQPYSYNRITDGLKTSSSPYYSNNATYSNGYTTVETAPNMPSASMPSASNYAATTPSAGTNQPLPDQQVSSSNSSSSSNSPGDPYGRAPSYERTVGGGLIGGVTGGLVGAACCGNPIVGAGAGIVIGIIGGVIAGAAIDAVYPAK